MNLMSSWVVTLAFLFCFFLIGKYLQRRERSERMIKRAEQAMRAEAHPPQVNSLAYGTIYGGPTQFERRKTRV
jgi:hypothetical protein